MYVTQQDCKYYVSRVCCCGVRACQAQSTATLGFRHVRLARAECSLDP